MNRRRRWVAICALGLGAAIAAIPGHASGLLKDVDPAGNGYDDLHGFWLPFDGDVVFWGKGTLGIWRTDGTPAGTVKIQSYVGALDQPNGEGGWGVSADQAVFFYANDGFYGSEVWRTDGTNGGALRLTDLVAGSGPADLDYWNASGGQFFFNANQELYTSDGTTPASVHGVYGGNAGAIAGGHVLDWRGKLLFGCSVNFVDGPCVRSGNTTTLLKQLQVNSDYVAVNEKAYFVATTVAEGKELWVTDGTPGGTKIVADLVLGAADANPSHLTRMDDKLYFIARDTTHGYELWSTDGTNTGMVAELFAGSGDGATGIYTAIDSVLYFTGYDATAGYELFRSNGTGATLVKDMDPGNGSGAGAGSAVNGKLVISSPVGNASYARVPWISDGTSNGTRVLDTRTGLTYGYHLLAANGKLIFPGFQQNSSAGLEPLEIDLERVTGHKWCSRPERTIADLGETTDTMKIPQWGGVESLTVSVDLGHTYMHDLRVRLTGPDNTIADLIDQPSASGGGSCTGDLMAVQFADSAPAAVCSNTRYAYPLHAQVKPVLQLSAYVGKGSKGEWTLKVTDLATGDVGTLHEWCLNFQTDRLFYDGFND